MAYAAFRDQFAEAMDPRLYPIEHLDQLLIAGQAQFFATDKAAIVTEIKTFPTGAKAVCGLIAAGDLAHIENLLIPRAEQWGKRHGCTFGMIESRPGWAKRMKRHGYEVFQVAIIKEL